MTRTRTALHLSGAAVALTLLASCGNSELECMERAMYFESNRSSRDGMVAVGSVVMNRVESGDYEDDVCGVVAQRNQFAPGVMTRRMDPPPVLTEAAKSVLDGERHPMVGEAQFFHAASYNADYNNMHYVVTTGGNAFYERRDPELVTQPDPLPPVEGITGRW